MDFSSETKRENWVIQWFCRAFAAGVRKVMVKDASPGMARSVKTMVELLPDPFPMEQVNKRIGVSLESASVYRVERRSDGGWTYVAWAENGSWLDRSIELPIRSERAFKVSRDGKRKELTVSNGHVHVTLSSGTPFAEPVFVVEE